MRRMCDFGSKWWFRGHLRAFRTAQGKTYIPLGNIAMALGYTICDCLDALKTLGSKSESFGRECVDFGVVDAVVHTVDLMDWCDDEGQTCKMPIVQVDSVSRATSDDETTVLIPIEDVVYPSRSCTARFLARMRRMHPGQDKWMTNAVFHLEPTSRLKRISGEKNGKPYDFIASRAWMKSGDGILGVDVEMKPDDWDAIAKDVAIGDDAILFAKAVSLREDGWVDKYGRLHQEWRAYYARYVRCIKDGGSVVMMPQVNLPTSEDLKNGEDMSDHIAECCVPRQIEDMQPPDDDVERGCDDEWDLASVRAEMGSWTNWPDRG